MEVKTYEVKTMEWGKAKKGRWGEGMWFVKDEGKQGCYCQGLQKDRKVESNIRRR
jgi:hypothetical protein